MKDIEIEILPKRQFILRYLHLQFCWTVSCLAGLPAIALMVPLKDARWDLFPQIFIGVFNFRLVSTGVLMSFIAVLPIYLFTGKKWLGLRLRRIGGKVLFGEIELEGGLKTEVTVLKPFGKSAKVVLATPVAEISYVPIFFLTPDREKTLKSLLGDRA